MRGKIEIGPKPPVPPTCDRAGCKRPTKWQVAFEFPRTPDAGTPRVPGQPILVEVGLFICEEDGKLARTGNILGNVLWAQIKAGFEASGKIPPDRYKAVLRLVPLLNVG